MLNFVLLVWSLCKDMWRFVLLDRPLWKVTYWFLLLFWTWHKDTCMCWFVLLNRLIDCCYVSIVAIAWLLTGVTCTCWFLVLLWQLCKVVYWFVVLVWQTSGRSEGVRGGAGILVLHYRVSQPGQPRGGVPGRRGTHPRVTIQHGLRPKVCDTRHVEQCFWRGRENRPIKKWQEGVYKKWMEWEGTGPHSHFCQSLSLSFIWVVEQFYMNILTFC